MLVRYKAGRHAGEIRDLRSDVALEMLQLGRVDRAFTEEPVAAAPRPVVSEPIAKASKPAKKRAAR